MNDTELLELLGSSPQEGLAAVVGKYSAYVYKIAYNRLVGVCAKEDIEEAVSDIFMKLYTSMSEKGVKPRSVCAYLSVIAQRHCTDVLRRQRANGQHISLDEIENIIPDEEVTADSGQIMQVLKKLGEPDTEILVRRYYLGQPVKQIALEMNMKTDTLNKRLSRGLKKLRKMLEEEGLLKQGSADSARTPMKRTARSFRGSLKPSPQKARYPTSCKNAYFPPQ